MTRSSPSSSPPCPAIGFTLQPEQAFLDAVDPLLHGALVDYYEVAPETLWYLDPREALRPNGFHRRFQSLAARTGRAFVAHGVGLSMGTAYRADAARRRRWLARVREDHAVFAFRWYTDHLGASALAGLAATLPIPLPMTAHAAGVVRARLRAMQRVVPDAGVENTASYFVLGDPLDEARFLARVVRGAGPRAHLLLDLHNVATMAHNLGFDARRYIELLPLERVIEVHLAGGSESEPAWLPSRRVLRLDSHEDAVPEAVWALFEWALPRCPNVRGVTLERMEGTVTTEAHVATLRAELGRARRMARPRKGPRT